MRPTIRRAFTIATVICGCCAVSVSRAGLVVLQVEAADTEVHYAPVDFNGAKSITIPGGSATGFGGLRFYADSGIAASGTDISVHANQVGTDFYGPNSPGRPYVSSVRVLTSGDFIDKYLRPALQGPAAGKLPKPLPGGTVRVVNASFAGSTQSDALDGNILVRTDYLVNHDGVFIAAGAVCATSGTFAGVPLLWAARNVMAVRGGAPESKFDPSTTAVGRRYADIWGDNTASEATARVSSMAIELIGEALAARRTGAAKPAAVRATLMAGADRHAGTPGVAAWSREQQNGLDTDLGAGKADFPASQAILRGTAFKPAAFTGQTIKGPVALSPATATKKSAKIIPTTTGGLADSWTIRPGQNSQALFQVATAVQGATAALAWDTVVLTGAVGNLTLELRPVTITSRGDAQLSDPLVSIAATTDNVRFLTYDGTLAPGAYAWCVSNVGQVSLTPSLAFRLGGTGGPSVGGVTSSAVVTLSDGLARPGDFFAAVPEPASLVPVGALGMLASRRRRA